MVNLDSSISAFPELVKEFQKKEPEKPCRRETLAPEVEKMIGTVIGEIALEKGLVPCTEHRWVQVRTDVELLEAVDLAGCQKGDRVLLLTGKTARKISMGCPGDWAAAAVLGSPGNNG